LRKSSTTGKFVVITSGAGSIGEMMPAPIGPYALSKTAVNYLTVKIQQENPDIIAAPLW
jgi:NAD(P)-dependent dehydrogenase (short-subunit alcohol dehydrogenase family)